MSKNLTEGLLKVILSIKIAAQMHYIAGQELDKAAEELQKLYLELENVGNSGHEVGNGNKKERT